MIFMPVSQFHVDLPCLGAHLAYCLNTPLLNHSVCCVFRVTNFHGVMCVTTQYAAQSLRCETVLGAADTAQAAVVLWSFGEKGNTLILDILEINLHLKC